MSASPLEVIRDQYAAVNERDFERARAYYADDVVMDVHTGGVRAGHYSGRAEVEEWFADWFGTFARDARFDITELSELDDGRVLVVAEHRASGRASGIEVGFTVVWTHRVEHGLVTRLAHYATREEAVAGS